MSDALLNVDDYAQAARERLPRDVYDYYAGGAGDEVTLAENEAAWRRLPLHYRVLAGVGPLDPATTVLGQPVSMPVLVAPTAFHGLACPEGELATARAARAARTCLVLSSLSNTSMERVYAETDQPAWFQLYVYRDREVTRSLIDRAREAGAGAIVLTVDAPGWGTRERDVRNAFHLPQGLEVANLAPAGRGDFPAVGGSGLAAYVREHFEETLGFPDLEWLCQATPLPVVVKGVCRGDDARRCIDHGAAGVVVSNHGGRQLDTAPATCDVLPFVAEAVAGAAEVYVDGGIRRGSDVVKALALGAWAVLVGRPVLWGLAVGGEKGALAVLEILRRELAEAMLLCGSTDVDAIDRSLLEAG